MYLKLCITIYYIMKDKEYFYANDLTELNQVVGICIFKLVLSFIKFSDSLYRNVKVCGFKR